MIFVTEKATALTLTVVTRTDHEGVWVMCHDPNRFAGDDAADMFAGRSWIQAKSLLEDNTFALSTFADKQGAQDALAAMVKRWGVGTISGDVQVRTITAEEQPSRLVPTGDTVARLSDWAMTN